MNAHLKEHVLTHMYELHILSWIRDACVAWTGLHNTEVCCHI